MKRTLQIHIDANRVTCGKCKYVGPSFGWGTGLCNFFKEELRYTSGIRRCAPCLAAERDAGGGA